MVYLQMITGGEMMNSQVLINNILDRLMHYVARISAKNAFKGEVCLKMNILFI